MNKNLQEPIEKVSARRRLVRGAFAAPAVLSLYSGSALAASSNQCLTKEVGQGHEPAPGSESAAYVRVQLLKVIRTKNTTKFMNLVPGDDVAALHVPNTLPTYLQEGEWQCFSTNINKESNKPFPIDVGETATGAIPTDGFSTEPGAFVALKIDAAGNIKGVVGIGGTTTDGSAVHESCWTSFTGFAP